MKEILKTTHQDTLFDESEFISHTEWDEEKGGNESNSCQQGDICESQFALDAKHRGFEVFKPDGHATKVDLAIRKPGFGLVSVQIKKAVHNIENGNRSEYWKFICGAGKPSAALNNNDYGKRYTRYVVGDFDVLGAYIMELNIWTFYTINDVTKKSSIQWRPNSGQVQNNWSLFDSFFTKTNQQIL